MGCEIQKWNCTNYQNVSVSLFSSFSKGIRGRTGGELLVLREIIYKYITPKYELEFSTFLSAR